MTTRALSPFRILVLALLGALVAAGAITLAAPPASAHDTLVGSSPQADSTVDTLPSEIALTFSAEIFDGQGTNVTEVTGPDDFAAHTSEPIVDGVFLTTQLAAQAPAGEYRVVWRVVSSDGHPISGEFSFTVSTSTLPETSEPEPTQEPTQAPTQQPTTEPTSSPGDGSPADGDAFVDNLPWIVLGLLLAAGGGAVIAVLIARARSRNSASGDAAGR